MRWCALSLSVCVLLTGCIAGVQDTGSVGTRVTHLEGRVKGLEKATFGDAEARGSLEQRMDTLAQEQKYLRKDLDEFQTALTRLEENTSSLRIEVSRLKDRFDQIETGVLAREKRLTDQVDSVAGIGDQFHAQLEDLHRQAAEAVRIATEADGRTKTAMNDMYDRMKLLDREVESLYDDILGALSGGRKAPPDGHHVVKAGETLGSIARTYGVTVDAILEANPQITNRNIVQKGQKIKIP